MSNFSFRNISREPDKPSGAEKWLFWNPKTDAYRSIDADHPDDAWKGIRFYEEAEWMFWLLLGRSDLVAEGIEQTQVSAHFAHRNPSLVERWEENDEE